MNLKKKTLLLVLGTCIISVGIALLKQADIGVSPLSNCPFVLWKVFPAISFGTWILSWNALFAILQIPLEGKNYKPYMLFQVVLAIILGKMTDVASILILPLATDNYIGRVIMALAAVMVTAFGVLLTVRADFLMNGTEAFVSSLSAKTGIKFGTLKTIFDLSNVALAAIASLILFHNIQGIREGTILSAVMTGVFVNLFGKMFPRIGA